jgi:hypothetical protein
MPLGQVQHIKGQGVGRLDILAVQVTFEKTSVHFIIIFILPKSN